MKQGDKILYEGDICTIQEIYPQANPSPSGDILLKDKLGNTFLVNHNEIDPEDVNTWCEECETEYATYTYKDELLCSECLMNKLEEENKIETWSVKHFMIDGEYFGNDNDNDFDEIVDDITKKLKIKKVGVR